MRNKLLSRIVNNNNNNNSIGRKRFNRRKNIEGGHFEERVGRLGK